ncbi:WD40/YVTN/BNR-like repeat-containing protein [Cecembia rubra]|uniref:WD40/YVTN/BNR-like repeat-containing protein n=1 Tax=Cecembia rubra TaxID=1485585 RepID=UPI002714DA18|nr:glycosyl hydrolase [Cecembia rubra]
MKRKFYPIVIWAMSACLTFQINQSAAQQVKASSAKEMQEAVKKHQEMLENSPYWDYPARNVGPTNMSGRIVDIEVSSDFKTYYIAAASGGVWKTTDNGQSFIPIFDHLGALGIGDMAIAPSNDQIIWVGTGENNSSRSTYAGAGVFKSSDAGKSWEFMGLPFSHHIGQIQIHPQNPDIVWVGSMGALYSRNEERGLYKTIDGGKTWKKTLYINENTGVIDIKVHPQNPNIILAATWERFRQSHDFIGNGKGSGIWRSEDGGETWKKAMEGFPQDQFIGRIGFDFSLSNPNIVYALLDNQKPQENSRPQAPRTAPKDELSLESIKTMSVQDVINLEDEKLEKVLRSNRFASKYNANNVKRLLKLGRITPAQIANYHGGGQDANAALFNTSITGAEVYRSTDAGKSWSKVNESNLDRLYNTYGYYFGEIRVSTQSEDEVFILGVPLLVSRDGGRNFARTDTVGDVHSDHQALWINPKDSKHLVLGNDGGLYLSYGGGERWNHLNTELTISQFYSIMVDEKTPYNIYGGMQDNGVWYGKSTGKPSDLWTSLMGGDGMVVAVDTRSNDIVYTGFQFGNYFRINTATGERKMVTPAHDIGRSPNRWNWRTPAFLSQHNQDIFYMGSQYVYRSLDRGDTWETISPDLTKNQKSGNVPFATLTVIEESPLEFGTIYAGSDDGNLWITRDHGASWTDISKGLPQDRWVSSITPSQHKEGIVYVTLTGYRFDEFIPHVFKSTDYGKTWNSIAAELPHEAVNILKEDHKFENILYVGTDHGLYISSDGGKTYNLFQGHLPNVAIYDIAIQKRENDLVIGTHGRSVFIIDLKPIHQLMTSNPNEIQIFKASEIRFNPRLSSWLEGIVNKPRQNILFYTPVAGETKFEIKNDKGEVIQSWTHSARIGFNQSSWEFGDIGRGKYKILISVNNEKGEKEFEVI